MGPGGTARLERVGSVRLERVSKWYGPRRRPALLDVTLVLEPGEVVAVAGPNGSGKTTLLRILAGATVPSRGRVPARPRPLGYLPERFPPRLRFTPAEYLGHMGRARGLPSAAIALRTGELAARLGFEDALGVPLASLSKGTCQKVALAQALLQRPRLLLLDEPWAGLDARGQRELAAIVGEVRAAGGLVVVSDHREALLGMVADRICRLADGRLSGGLPGPAGDGAAGEHPHGPAPDPGGPAAAADDPPMSLIELACADPQDAGAKVRDLPGVLAVQVDGPLAPLRVWAAAGAGDALLAAALRLGLSVRRVEPLADPRGGGGGP